ncbi:tRNA pseudouridine(13) synthase TruD [Candidatus Woesearchaeota archaeon]|nr:tRNA pseudouridine(13) synthase TruD [Candidatus Woesearchaeota archaeon]
MYKIKQTPEDFVVKELATLDFDDKGNYSYYLMWKKEFTTQKAVEKISRIFGIKDKFINYAGNKDKNAITEQYISINNGPKKEIETEELMLKFLGKGKERINLGDLEGNKFIITVRNIENKPKRITKIVNYFDDQRFGINKNNHVVGKLIIKKKFKEAVEEIDQEAEENNYISSLREIPKRILRLYVHAYQSYLWNKTVEEYIKTENKNTKIPLVGFGTELKGKLKKIVENLMKQEEITLRDFIIREIPELSSEGNERDLFAEIKNLKISDLENDELNKTKKKYTISFELQKGSYATQVIKQLFS